jgi:hypothetical protein
MRAGIAPLASFGNGLPNGGPRAAWIQGDPADSVYKAAREALNRGDYRTAARQFETCRTKFAASHYVADCGYWQAFALYRLGSMDDLKTAMQALDAISGRSADLSRQTDVPGLRTRINSALAMRGDATAADQLRKDAQQAGGATCDKEDQSVRVEALSTLGQMDPEAALPTLRSVLSRKDACSVDLRRQAIVLLSRRNDTTAATILSQVAKNDPDVNVRQTAVEYLGRFPGTVSFNTLDDLLKTSTDESLQISVIDALGRSADPRANQSLRSYLDHATSDRLQVAAIRAISGDYSISVNVYNSNFRINDRAPAAWTISTPVAPPGTPAAAAAKAGNGVGSGVGAATPGSMAASAKAATAPSVLVQQMQVAGRGARRGGTATTRPADDNEAFLRTFYPKAKTDVVKEAVISAVASYAGDNTQPFLLAVAANTAESSNVRGFALGRVGMSGAPIASLVKLYDAADSRFMREQLIAVFQARPEPEASDKLFDIIKLGTDPDLQKEAIRALTNKKNDPRATKLLNDLINGRGGI